MAHFTSSQYFTYEPRSSRAAVVQLGHLGELVGEENVLGNHRDLQTFSYTEPSGQKVRRANEPYPHAVSHLEKPA